MPLSKRVLVIEDEVYLSDIYLQILKMGNFHPTPCYNGDEALLLLKQGGWDLVLLDIMLPKMDGLQILEDLEANPPKKPNGPIIILTNLGKDAGIIEKIHHPSVLGYITKSDTTPGDVLQKVKQVLQNWTPSSN